MQSREENDAVAFVVLGVAKLRAKFFINQAKGAAAVGPLAHDRSPGVREYGDRTGDGLCRKGISRECGGRHPAGAHREYEGAACVAFSEFGRDPGHDCATKSKKRASRLRREALWTAAASTESRPTLRALAPQRRKQPLPAGVRRGRVCARRRRGWTTK